MPVISGLNDMSSLISKHNSFNIFTGEFDTEHNRVAIQDNVIPLYNNGKYYGFEWHSTIFTMENATDIIYDDSNEAFHVRTGEVVDLSAANHEGNYFINKYGGQVPVHDGDGQYIGCLINGAFAPKDIHLRPESRLPGSWVPVYYEGVRIGNMSKEFMYLDEERY